jgi:acyl dehydratase
VRSIDIGTQLPTWELPITTTLVVSTALATRDFQDVHHDRDLAQSHGSKDIFLNILTTTGLVQRYVGEWAGHEALVRACELRLGAPAYPGDTLTFSGTVGDVVEADGERRHVVDVVGVVSLGAHVTARVTLVLPDRAVDPTSAIDPTSAVEPASAVEPVETPGKVGA